jgi:parallel beta-helix repeat protein
MRPNALALPGNWKQEYAWRHASSKTWRHTAQTRTHKVRRFATKMLTAVFAPPAFAYLRVDPRSADPRVFPTINAALAKAGPFDVLLIEPGVYQERLRLEKPVELVGMGAVGSTVVIGTDGPTVETASRARCRISGVRIEQRAQSDEAACKPGAVLIKGGASLVLEDSVVSSETGHCIVLQGAGSYGVLRHNLVHDAFGVGILVCDHASGVIEDNTIAANGRAGIAILTGGDPLVRANVIRDGKDSGVLISEKGKGKIEGNDIYGNRRAGVAIFKEGMPLVKRNKIHDGHDSGVLVTHGGRGSVVDNDIFANQMAGVAIGRGGASRVTGNVIRDGNGGSLCLSSLSHSHGLISANVIHQLSKAPMQVPTELLPEVKEHNLIRYLEPGSSAPTVLAA